MYLVHILIFGVDMCFWPNMLDIINDQPQGKRR